MVWYFFGEYIINRTLHGRLEIRNFSSRVVVSCLFSSYIRTAPISYWAHRFQNTSQNPKTRPRIQNTSQNPRNFPESKNTSQNPNTLPRIQNTSLNPKHFPGDARAYHEWPRVIAGTVICKLVTRSLVVDGRRVEASRILECEDLSFPKKHTFVDVRCDQILWERASFSLWRIF